MTHAPMVINGKINDKQFNFLAEYLSSKYGLRIPAEKRVLLESRLLSRLNALKMSDIDEYLNYTFKSAQPNDEYVFFIDQITTHKTFFFREKHQFDYIGKILKHYLNTSGSNTVNFWSAGCSTGEEVFTIGMMMNELKQDIPFVDYRILGTDISVPSLRKAAKGVFTNELENLPDEYKAKYFTSEIRNGREMLEFTHAEVKNRIQLGIMNLNKPSYNLPFSFDFIFCRNVTIYFDAKTREQVLGKLVDKLKPGGYLFLGHSETALGMTLPIKSILPTIYRKI